MNEQQDTLEVRELLATVRRGWRWVAAGALMGVLIAISMSFLLPPRYQSAAAVLLRSGNERSAISLRGMAGGLGGLVPGGMQSGFDTELELLTSRTGIDAVIDTLHLQAVVLRPRRVGPSDLFASSRFAPDLKKATYRFRLEGDGYRVEGPGATGVAVPGVPYEFTGGVLTLRTGPLPEEFRIRLLDRDEAVQRVIGNLDAGNPGGDIAELVYRASDPRTAAAVPNALVANYMHRRQTSDRGVNQRRYEFLLARTDSVERALAQAEDALRAQQERTGRFDPQLFAGADLERATALRAELETLTMESQALGRLLEAGAAGDLSPRALAAYPTFLRNEAINDLLSRLLEQEQERLELLERRTESDPDVLNFDQRILQLETQLVSLATAYLDGLAEQRRQLEAELATYRTALSAVPGEAQEALRNYREVERLSEILLVMHAQLLEARLDAITEGGDVRQVDEAVPPLRPDFPQLPLNLAIGLFGGLFLGILGAFGRSLVSDRVEHPRQAELATGVPAVAFQPGAPLLLANVADRKCVLVVPVGPPARTRLVAEHIAATAALRGESVALAQLGGSIGNGKPATAPRASASEALVPTSDASKGYLVYRDEEENGSSDPADLRMSVEQLEERVSLVVAELPSIEHPYTTALLSTERPVILVGRIGVVTRAELREAVDALRRAGILTAGIVLGPAGANGEQST